jgi:hypothetical protein
LLFNASEIDGSRSLRASRRWTFDGLELRAVDVMQLPAAAASLLPAVPPNRRASELEAAPVAPA